MSTPARPVSADEKVSDVLARDESLIEVFVRQAPHFEKLRNRAMRKVMARLVTVEQAARAANVTPDRLVNELNAALGLAVAATPPSSAGATAGSFAGATAGSSAHVEDRSSAGSASEDQRDMPAAEDLDQRRHPADARVVEVDVREDLRSGREPFSRIMSAVAALGEGEVLRLRAIFEPVPLFSVMAKRGFAHESEAHADDDWSAWFWRPALASSPPTLGAAAAAAHADVPPDDEHTIHLDVRGLNPPEPMMRTLAALQSLAPGQTLVQVNERVPQFLLPMLAERGFAWEVEEPRPGRVLVRISRAP